nr:hypothetical protein [Tanacetum cinerariifolium]
MRHLSQHYIVTWTLDYAVTSFKPARWKVHVSSLRRKPLKGCLFVVGLSGGGSGGSVRVVERGREVRERGVLQLAGKPVRSEQWMVFKRGGDDRLAEVVPVLATLMKLHF